MIKKLTFKKLFESYIGLFLIVTVLFPKLIALVFIGFLPFVIVGMVKKQLQFSLNWMAIGFILLYLIYALYAIFTRHPELASRYFENKLSFIILPILLCFKLKEGFSYRIPLTLFLLGLVIFVIECFVGSITCYLEPGGSKLCFLTSGFSPKHHPTYTNVYLLFGMIGLFVGRKQNYRYFNLYWIIPVFVLFLVAYLLCLSLAGILFLFLLAAVLVVRFVYLKFGKIAALGFSVIAPFLMYFTIISIPQVEGEWTNAKWYMDKYLQDPEAFVKNRKYPMSGTEVRIVMWLVSYKAICDYPMGVGTGNVDEVLTSYLNRLDQKELAKQEYNPHNQYFQTFLEAGVFALLILVLILVAGIYHAVKYKNWILLIMTLSLAFNMIFESMLQRQDGIVFYTFVLSLLVIYPFKKLAKQ